MRAIEIDGIFRRQPRRLRQPRHDAERGPAREARDRRQPLIEQSNIAAKLVDDEAVDPRQFVRLQNQMRAGKARDDAAAIDVPEHHHGHIGGRGKSHIGDVAGAQVDLRRTAGAFDQDDIGIAREMGKTLQHRRQQGGLLVQIVLCAQRAPAFALHDDLRAGIGLRLQQHRVHVHARRHPRRPRLHGLGAADLAALDRDGGIVRHVLRLERRHLQAAPHQRAREPCDDRRLAGIGAGGLDHQRGRRPLHQNSMPFWPFTPARNGCFTSVISVTRSAISISSGLALRPVMTTCLSAGFSSRRKVRTSLRSR